MQHCIINGLHYGPLAKLVGSWYGNKGLDVSPEPQEHKKTDFHENLTFEAIGCVTNAKQQTLAALRYHQVVIKNVDNCVFHNETGYWMWDSDSHTIMQSLTIPRGVCVLAGGHVAESYLKHNTVSLEVIAKDGSTDWGILQSPFMQNNAKTIQFTHSINVSDTELTYSETMLIDIYGKSFEHKDGNTLHKTNM